jgi:hypothetical protein
MIIRKLILFAFTLGIIWTISIIDADAQTKKNASKVTQISTSAAAKAIEVNGVIIDVYDLKGQLDNLIVLRLSDEAKGMTARDPIMTLIKDESLGLGAFRLAETLEEASKESDSVTVLKMAFSALEHNMRSKYN